MCWSSVYSREYLPPIIYNPFQQKGTWIIILITEKFLAKQIKTAKYALKSFGCLGLKVVEIVPANLIIAYALKDFKSAVNW